MINAVRTYLLNSPANLVQSPLAPAYVDPGFSPAAVADGLQPVRNALFGTAPDASGLQYVAYLLLRCIGGSKLRPYGTYLDSRITYSLGEMSQSLAGLPRMPSLPAGAPFQISGGEAASASGKVRCQFSLFSPDGSTLGVTDLSTGFGTSGGSPLPLGGTGYSASLLPGASGQAAAVSWYAIRRNPLGDCLDLVRNHLGGESVDALFGANPAGPYADFRKSFDCGSSVEGLAGAALALAFQTAGV